MSVLWVWVEGQGEGGARRGLGLGEVNEGEEGGKEGFRKGGDDGN